MENSDDEKRQAMRNQKKEITILVMVKQKQWNAMILITQDYKSSCVSIREEEKKEEKKRICKE